MATEEEYPAIDEAAPDQREHAFKQARQYVADPKPVARGYAAKFIAATGAPKEALELLSQLADDPVPGVRLSALVALAGSPWRGRLELLARKLEDKDVGVAIVAAAGLAHSRDRRAGDKLVELAQNSRVRFEALESLYELGDPRFAGMARGIFGAFFGGPFERGLAALALAEQGDAKAKEYLLTRASKKRAEERPLLIVNLARVLPVEGRALVEHVAQDSEDYLRESALLALTRVDASWWSRAQEAIGRYVDDDPHVAAEVLEGLFEIGWDRAVLIAQAHVEREGELGQAARRVRLAAALRHAYPNEVLLRCA